MVLVAMMIYILLGILALSCLVNNNNSKTVADINVLMSASKIVYLCFARCRIRLSIWRRIIALYFEHFSLGTTLCPGKQSLYDQQQQQQPNRNNNKEFALLRSVVLLRIIRACVWHTHRPSKLWLNLKTN